MISLFYCFWHNVFVHDYRCITSNEFEQISINFITLIQRWKYYYITYSLFAIYMLYLYPLIKEMSVICKSYYGLLWSINKHCRCTHEWGTKRTSHVVWYTFELIQNFIIAIKDIKRTTLFNFMVHTVWFYGQCCAKKEFLVDVSE